MEDFKRRVERDPEQQFIIKIKIIKGWG